MTPDARAKWFGIVVGLGVLLPASVLLSAACALTRPLWPVFDWIDNGRR